MSDIPAVPQCPVLPESGWGRITGSGPLNRK